MSMTPPTPSATIAAPLGEDTASVTAPDHSRPAHTRRYAYLDADSSPPLAKTYVEISKLVREAGLMRRTPWFYAIIGLILATALAGCITGFILLGHSWFQLLIAGALGIVFTQVAFLSHEAAHRQILTGGKSNDRLARILGVGIVGMSYSWWDSKHSRHHANPNKIAKDPDIATGAIVFQPEDSDKKRGIWTPLTKIQGWAFFPLLLLEGINLHYQSVGHLVGPGKVKGRWLELGLFALRFAAFLVPLFLLLPVGMAFAFLGVQLAVFGVYMGASFAPNHKGMPLVSRHAKLDFFSKQVRTSRNIRGGWWATWLMGGLNYQVEHHLFPGMSRMHLARTQHIVKAKCAELKLPYTETSLWRSYAIVISYLNRVGLGARDPFECPMIAEFRRG